MIIEASSHSIKKQLKNMKAVDEMNSSNSLNSITSSIIRNEDNVTSNREHCTILTVDKKHSISMEDARLSAFKQKVEESKKTPIYGVN